MRIAVIDADLVGKKKHRFPNLSCMKISSHYKNRGDIVELKLDYKDLEQYDKVFIAKVFTSTPINEDVLALSNVEYGGTGFFYDRAKFLPDEIEHSMPDYHLYDEWLKDKDTKKPEYRYYKDYSIGFLTRGCFRKCPFCVNKNYDRVEAHSPLSEFVDSTRKKICLLDDNFFGYGQWKKLFTELQETGKRFQFKQGLDERLLTDEKCEMLFNSKYDGDFIFAFDNWADREIIEEKLKLIRKYTTKVPKFYCLCGFDREGKWDYDFWIRDLQELFHRIAMLGKYGCLPYIMRYARYEESPYRGIYITLAQWCNQPALFKKKSLIGYAELTTGKATRNYVAHFLETFPDAEKWIELMRFKEWGGV